MQISVSGKKIDIGVSLQEYVRERIDQVVHKYFEHPIKADIVFSKEAHLYKADLLVNEGTGVGVIIKSSANSDEIYSSFDTALVKIEKQLRRYKSKLKNHHKPKLEESQLKATKYVISPQTEEESIDDNPLIIAEKATSIERLTVGEAVMRMDLEQLPALLFINRKNNRVNVVYHRVDGNISWVDTDE